MLGRNGNHYEFGDHRLDLSEQTLHKGDERIALTPKAFETLVFFLENPGRLIQKNELMESLWPDRFVEEGNLTFHIGLLRKALGDDPKNPRYIETVARRGYRFVAETRSTPTDAPTRNGVSAPTGDVRLIPSYPQSPDTSTSVPEKELAAAGPKISTANSNGSNPAPAEAAFSSARKTGRRANGWVIAASVVTVLAVIGAYAAYWLKEDPFVPPAVTVPKMSRLTSSGNTKAAAASPDGKFVAYVLEEAEKNTLWLKNVRADSAIQIPLPERSVTVSNFTFSPDGDFLYFGVSGVLYRLPVLGGDPVKILDGFGGGQYNNISFSPDGARFAFLRATGTDKEEVNSIIISDADGGNQRILASSRRPNLFLRSVAWSPDGEKIACISLNKGGRQFPVVFGVADGATIPFTPSRTWEYAAQIVWKPSGDGLHLLGEDRSFLTQQIFSLSYPGGDAKNIVDDSNSYLSLSPTADGTRIVAVRASQESHIWTATVADPTTVKQLTHGFEKFDGVLGLNWTTDGRVIYESRPAGTPRILSIDSEGAESKRLVNEGGTMVASPDGRYLVYQQAIGDSVTAAGYGLFRFDVASGAKTQLTSGTDSDLFPAFSPDSRDVVFTRYGDDVALWRVPADGGDARRLTDFHGLPICPSYSPDGSYIAFYRARSGKMKYAPLAIIDAQNGKIVKDFEMPSGAEQHAQNRPTVQWRPDGGAVLYAVLRNGVSNLWEQPIAGGDPVQVTHFEAGQIFNFAISPDGKRIAYSRGTYSRDVIALNLK